MRRLFAWTLTLWYALMVSGIYLHVHYCCGRVLDISLNPASAVCSSASPDDHGCHASHQPTETEKGCCSSTGCHSDAPTDHTDQTLSKPCCSSDDVYIAIEDAHDKSVFSLTFPLSTESLSAPFQRPVSIVKPPVTHPIDARAGPPLYLLFVSRIDYA